MNRSAPWVVCVVLAAAHAQTIAFPAGTTVPIRFLNAVTSGRDTVGTPVIAQTFAAMVRDSCVIVPPYAEISGRVVRSIGGRRLGRSGQLDIEFDSLELRPGTRMPIHAVLDTLEYARSGRVGDSGVVHAHTSTLPIAIGAAATVVDVVPAALFGGYLLVRKGARASILAGEVGAVRLVEPVTVPDPPACNPVATHADLQDVPALPRFVPYASDKSGRKSGDAINLIFLGPGQQIDGAFVRAGWVAARPASLWALTREVTAAIASRPAVGAPVSTLYFEGRKEDLAYELSGPNARIRHHVRIWLLDSLAGIWVGAGTKDIGLRVRPLHARATHRIDPNVDRERDMIASTLESVGCGDLLDYLTLPGADTVGHTIDGQHFRTDARSAVIRMRTCSSASVLNAAQASDGQGATSPTWPLLINSYPVLDTARVVPLPNDTFQLFRTDITLRFKGGVTDPAKRTFFREHTMTVLGVTRSGQFFVRIPDPGPAAQDLFDVLDTLRHSPAIGNAAVIPFISLRHSPQ